MTIWCNCTDSKEVDLTPPPHLIVETDLTSSLTLPVIVSRRDPSALINGKKKDSVTEEPSSEQDGCKPKATRNILLIRHSQYNLSGNNDKERILTPLGCFSLSISLHNTDAVFSPGSVDLSVSTFRS